MSNELKQVELAIDDAKELVATRDAMIRLSKNRDFKKIFEQGYFKEHASRLVCNKALPQLQGEANQEAIDKGIIAIGETREYIRGLFAMGNEAEKAIVDGNEMREEILAQDAGE